MQIQSPASRMGLKDKLREMQCANSALLATNFYNYETLRGILNAAVEARSPVILQLTKSSIDYIGLNTAVKMARAALQEYNVEGWIHLDHAGSYELVHRCLDAGFDSVMIDASELPLHENIAITRKVVELAAGYQAQVEAELGYVAKLGQSKEIKGFTEPAEASYFVKETGVDSLAVAIGSAHGFYVDKPKLDLERLQQIQEITDVCLVLHGGSGIPSDTLKKAIRKGICKINLATEIKNIFMLSLQKNLQKNTEIDLRIVFPPAISAISGLVKNKLEIVRKGE